jgi:hypothetical protein
MALLDMKFEDLLSHLEKLGVNPNEDYDIDPLVIRRIKQTRLKNKNDLNFESQLKRIEALIGSVDPDDTEDNEDYGDSDADDEDSEWVGY